MSMHCVLGLLILIPMSSNALLHVSKYSVMSVSSSPHSTMPYANIIDPGTSFLTSSVTTSIRSRNRYGLKAEPSCSPTSTPKLLLSPAALRTTVLHPRYMYWTSLMYFSGTFRSLEHLQISSLGMRSYAFSRFINVTYSNILLPFSVFLNCLFQYENRICCAPTWHEPKLTFVYIGALSYPPIHKSLPYFKSVR